MFQRYSCLSPTTSILWHPTPSITMSKRVLLIPKWTFQTMYAKHHLLLRLSVLHRERLLIQKKSDWAETVVLSWGSLRKSISVDLFGVFFDSDSNWHKHRTHILFWPYSKNCFSYSKIFSSSNSESVYISQMIVNLESCCHIRDDPSPSPLQIRVCIAYRW